jgi:cytochrome c
MMKLIRAALLALLSVGLAAAATAADRATLDEARAMVKKARAYIREVGAEKAFSELSNPKGRFVDRDLYVFVNDRSGVNLAHGGNQRLVGKNVMEMRDVDGVYFIKQFYAVAGKGGGTVDYKFLNPVTKEVEPKTTYIEMEGDYLIGAGVFRPAK